MRIVEAEVDTRFHECQRRLPKWSRVHRYIARGHSQILAQERSKDSAANDEGTPVALEPKLVGATPFRSRKCDLPAVEWPRDVIETHSPDVYLSVSRNSQPVGVARRHQTTLGAEGTAASTMRRSSSRASVALFECRRIE